MNLFFRRSASVDHDSSPLSGVEYAGAAHSRKRLSPRLYAVLVVAAGGFMALGTWANYQGVYRHDQYQLINLGQVIYDGGRLYIDCWENKPPGVAWIIATVLWVTGGSQNCVWFFPGVLGFVGIISLTWSLDKLYGPTEAVAVSLLACIMFSTRSFDTPSNHPDFYAAMFCLIGTSLFLVGLKESGHHWGMSAVAGFTWGCAAITRQTGLSGPIILTTAAFLCSCQCPSADRQYRRVALIAVSTCLAVIAGAIGLLWWRGNIHEAYDAIITFNRALLAQEHWASAARNANKLFPMYGPLCLPLALAAIGLFFVSSKKRRAPDRLLILGMALWFIVDNWLALLGPSQIDRYWIATWTPLLFMAAHGLSGVVRKIELQPRRIRLCIGVVGAVFTCTLAYPLVHRQINGRFNDGLLTSVTQYMTRTELLGERGTLRAIGRRVRGIVPETEKIYVLKYDPGIYLYAERASAAPFTYPRGTAQQDQILDVLEKDPPVLVLVPVEADPGLEWKMTPERVGRLYRIMNSYENVGSYLDYYFLVTRRTNG